MITIKQIKDAEDECIQKAKNRCARYGSTMSFCGSAKSWGECFSYLKNKDGSLLIVFMYNVGKYTYATSRSCKPKR